MPTITDHDQIIQDLRARLEESEHAREQLTIAIADHVEALGFEGRDADALVDARGQIERLLEGKDLGDDFEGIAGRVSVRCIQQLLMFKLLTPNVVNILQTASGPLGRIVAELIAYSESGEDGA